MHYISEHCKLIISVMILLLGSAVSAQNDDLTSVPSAENEDGLGTRVVPRNDEGRVILGSVPGDVGSWGGFGGRPMLTEFDEVPEGSIIAHTPYENLLADEDRFDKINISEVPFQPWARALFEARSRTRFEPYTRCKPSAGAREVATAYGTQFVEFPEMQRMYIFPTGGPRHFRIIYMDGRGHPEDLKPTYHGHSIGHWEGDTLVVDTIGFNEKMWIDAEGSPTTEQLHLIERFSRPAYDTLRYDITIDDPGAYTETWSSGFFMNWSQGESFEFVCQDQNMAFELMLGTEYQEVDRRRPIFP